MLKCGYLNERNEHLEEEVRPDQVEATLAKHRTVCAKMVNVADPALAAYIKDLQHSIVYGGRLDFNCYVSPDGKGFGTHFDNHSVFIPQIEGAKRW